ncbi:DNA polymerase III subunit delta [Thermosulfidibacter takaii]|nr:hypothetical protein [Thermosulfidibacter takaii]
MRVLTPKEFARTYPKKKSNVVFIFGSESAFIRRTLELVKETWKVPPESIKDFYDAEDVDLAKISDALTASSLFSSENIVILREAYAFFKGLSSREKESFLSLLKKLPATTCFVMVDSREDDVSSSEHSMLKQLASVDGVAVNCRRARSGELKAWLRKKLAKMGIDDSSLVEALIEASGGSMEALQKELEKLLTGFNKDSLSKTDSVSVYDFTNAVLDMDVKAFELLNKLYSLDVQPHIIIATLESSLRNILLWNVGLKRFPPFVERRFKKILENVGEKRVKELYEKAIVLERKAKLTASGDVLRKLLEGFVLDCIWPALKI